MQDLVERQVESTVLDQIDMARPNQRVQDLVATGLIRTLLKDGDHAGFTRPDPLG